MKENQYLYTEHALHAEYEDGFSVECMKLKMSLQNAIVSGDLDVVKNIAKEAAKNKYLAVIFSDDLEIQKLYIASTITGFVELSIAKGLPQNIGESKKRAYYRMIADAKITAKLIDYYFKCVEELIQETTEYTLQRYSVLVKKAIEAIHNNKFKPIYASDIAKILFVNRSHLSKKFAEEVGITLTEYIQKVKMDSAIKLMDSRLYKLNQVADLLGFSSYSYFCRIFKKYYSISPSEYGQAQVRNNDELQRET
jgi:YesN/AraC family two-component response regulator